MTREECEQVICEKVKEIWDVYKEYNPQGYHLSLFVNKEGLIMVNNEYWADDVNNKIRKEMNWK